MAIDTMDKLLAGLEAEKRINVMKVSQTAEGAGTFHSLIKVAGYPMALVSNPPTGSGECPTKAATYSLDFNNPISGNKKYIGRANFQGSTVGSLIIYDRLWHNAGLVGNITTVQNINSIPLTRYTDGINIDIFAEFYSAIGATVATLTVNYTDSDDVVRIGNYAHPANAESVGQMALINPPVGAKGCKSIQSVQWSVTTGTAGNFGMVIARRLAEIPLSFANIGTVMDAFGLGLPEIQNDACLCFFVSCSATNTGNIIGAVDIIEG